ncbi:MAG: leucyl aminopeptidase [Planctomycetes bacterium]|nr:leucyl aminopeptidase [Planctomycetota bacterium]
MRLRLSPPKSGARKAPLAILPVCEEDLKSGLPGKPFLSEALLRFVGEAIRAESFEAKAGQAISLHLSGENIDCLLVLGLGKRAEFSADALRSAMGEAARRVPKGIPKQEKGAAALLIDPRQEPWSAARQEGAGSGLARLAQAAGEGWILGGYAFLEHKTEEAPTTSLPLELHLLNDGVDLRGLERALRRAETIAEGVTLARNLANAPANEIHPVSLAARAKKLARRLGLNCRVLDERAIRKEKMGALLGVAQGSDAPPRFIIIEYRPKGRIKRPEPLIFVGKAITFDSGGLSIKPAKGMEEMKADMSGGAAVLCALGAIAQLKPAVRVIGLIPSAENMISGRAVKPGDVIRARSGLTIEVINTDAEGRLILADALDYSKRFKPRMVVDIATLTGACVVALGDVVSGLMSTDPETAALVRRAAEACGERVWELPLHKEYFEALKSDTADLKNSGNRNAGAITAAAFLSRFIEGTPWAHLDIAGTAWSEKEGGYRNKGATGAGVRLLVELASQYEKA